MDPNHPHNPASEPGKCPDDDSLRRMLRDEAEASATEVLARHLESCALCRRRIDALAGAEQVVPATAVLITARRESASLRSLMDRLRSREFALDGLAEESAPASNLEILSPPLRPGALGRFAGYDVLERIASGGMGVVFKAHDPALNRIVAIKVLAPVLAASESARRRFLREARAAAAVTHEHVVAIHAVGEHRGLPFLVMQFIAGSSLEARLQQGPLALAEILRIGHQTAQGLAAAHAQGLTHRDVKPGNILLENGVERVKLTDFGLARAADEPGVTRPGVLAGTPEFMSPEQARGERVDPRSDLFSLGCVLYGMATGTSAFAADSTPATLKRVCDLEPPPVHQVNPVIPEWLGDLIARLMSKRPEQRLASAAELARLLEESLRRLQAAPGAAEAPWIPPPVRASGLPPRRFVRSALGFALGALGALALVVVAMQLLRDRNPRRATVTPLAPEILPAPFRLLKPGTAPRGFPNLAEAVSQSEKGSIIEVAFDGPREVEPIGVTGQDLVLRAAPGMHPILVNRKAGEYLLRCDGSLTLEGLEFRAQDADSDSTALADPGPWMQRLAVEKMRERAMAPDAISALIYVRAGDFAARNCRFVTCLREAHSTDGVLIAGSRRAELTRCEFYTLDSIAVRWRSVGNRDAGMREAPSALTVSNCLFFTGRPLAILAVGGECQVSLAQNTFVSAVLLTLNLRGTQSVTAVRNVFVVRSIFDPRPSMGVLPSSRWQERQNLFSIPKGNASPREWVPGQLGPTSRIVQLAFRERMQPFAAQPRRITAWDFRITEEDARSASGASFEDLRQHGCQPETVGPGQPYHARSR